MPGDAGILAEPQQPCLGGKASGDMEIWIE
jgi:hypothetical protein